MTSRTAIQVLDRMMCLLDALAQSDEPESLKKLSEITELHPSTAHRILNDMVACRLVERADSGTYRLGLKLLELGNLVKARLSVREAAQLPMRALHKLTGQTVNLSVRQGDEIVYIDRAYSERSGMQVVRAIGGRAPLHLTSVCKLFLADDDSAKIKAYVAKHGLNGHTQNSIHDAAQLEKELELVKTLGHARDDEELEMGVSCMAAAILDDTGKLVAGLSLSAPTERIQEEWLKSLKETAVQISKSLGYKVSSTTIKE